jgi:hypothetical protein
MKETKENEMLLVAVGVWWTFAVIAWVMIMHDGGRDTKDQMLAIGLAVFWPAVAIGVVPMLVYQRCVASTARIRADFENRGIIREFEQWRKEKEGKIVPKEGE